MEEPRETISITMNKPARWSGKFLFSFIRKNLIYINTYKKSSSWGKGNLLDWKIKAHLVFIEHLTSLAEIVLTNESLKLWKLSEGRLPSRRLSRRRWRQAFSSNKWITIFHKSCRHLEMFSSCDKSCLFKESLSP